MCTQTREAVVHRILIRCRRPGKLSFSQFCVHTSISCRGSNATSSAGTQSLINLSASKSPFTAEADNSHPKAFDLSRRLPRPRSSPALCLQDGAMASSVEHRWRLIVVQERGAIHAMLSTFVRGRAGGQYGGLSGRG